MKTLVRLHWCRVKCHVAFIDILQTFAYYFSYNVNFKSDRVSDEHISGYEKVSLMIKKIKLPFRSSKINVLTNIKNRVHVINLSLKQ